MLYSDDDIVENLTPEILKKCITELSKGQTLNYMNPKKLVVTERQLLYPGEMNWLMEPIKSEKGGDLGVLFQSAISFTDLNEESIPTELLLMIFAEVAEAAENFGYTALLTYAAKHIIVTTKLTFDTEKASLGQIQKAAIRWLFSLPHTIGANYTTERFWGLMRDGARRNKAASVLEQYWKQQPRDVPIWTVFEMGNGQYRMTRSANIPMLKEHYEEVRTKWEIPEIDIHIG